MLQQCGGAPAQVVWPAVDEQANRRQPAISGRPGRSWDRARISKYFVASRKLGCGGLLSPAVTSCGWRRRLKREPIRGVQYHPAERPDLIAKGVGRREVAGFARGRPALREAVHLRWRLRRLLPSHSLPALC